MIFISLARWRRKQTKETVAKSNKLFDEMVKEDIKIVGQYWTLGRYDSIVITEAKDEKSAMRALMQWGESISTETLVAVPREEAIKLVE
jgi:uncharacterized protein with GYD domain